MTTSTTNFQEWFEQIDFEDENHEEVFELYNTVKNNENNCMFRSETINKGAGQIVRCSFSDTSLIIATEKAKKAFLKTLESVFCENMDIDSWYGFKVNMANLNS